MDSIWDIIKDSSSSNKYSAAKERLLNTFKESENLRIKRLLTGLELGDMRPTQLLLKLKSMGVELSDQMLRSLWLDKMPDAVKHILEVSAESLDKLAAMADKIVELNSRQELAVVSENKVVDELKNKVAALELQIASMSTRQPRSHSGNYGRERSHSRTYRDCGLSYRSIAARVGRDPMTVSRIWNRWVQDGNTERRAGSQRPPITSSREDRHIIRMALMDRATTSRAVSQETGSFGRQQVSARTVRRRLQQHGLSARRPWLRLPLTLRHRQERLQWCDQRRAWAHEWRDVIFSDESRKTREYFNYYFFRPYPHIGPYIIGLLLGYILAVKPTFKLSKKIQVLCWALAFTSSFSIIYGSVDWNRGRKPTVAETVFYASLSKSAWALSVAWVIFACATGYGGHVNRFLSWEGFVPLGRLSFMAYLVHPAVILIYISCLQTMQQASHFYLIWLFFGHLCITFILSFAASMLVEAPFISLTKMMFSRGTGVERSDVSEKVTSFPIQSLRPYSDVKLGVDNGATVNHDASKIYADEPVSDGIVSNRINENKERRFKLGDLMAQNDFKDDGGIVEKHELEDAKGNKEKPIKLSDLIAQNNFRDYGSSVVKLELEDVIANKSTDKKIKLSDLIAQNNFHDYGSGVEKHELEDVKIEGNKPSDEIEYNGKISEVIVKHEEDEGSKKRRCIHLEGTDEAGKESHFHLNGIIEAKTESHIQPNGNCKVGNEAHIQPNGNCKVGNETHTHLNGINEAGNESHIHPNSNNNAKNSNGIVEVEKNAQNIDVEVKATFFPGLGWKLG
ncbi:uncharacterized protein LOC129219995 [Uloborus diversus]|uniref:uncharacterized protein LOC129219995 n=1 Tax=Uloborus diversus TaxID=327109 RepID=UPI00240A50D3|nr:uncharacterized protein LOC129219995 [Uloborus diversus]